MKTIPILILSLILFTGCKQNNKSRSSDLRPTDGNSPTNTFTKENDTPYLKITSSLNNYHVTDAEEIDTINFSGIWILIDNYEQKDKTLIMDIVVHQQDTQDDFELNDFTVNISEKLTTIFLPQKLCDQDVSNANNQLFGIVLEGNRKNQISSEMVDTTNLKLEIYVDKLKVFKQSVKWM